LDQLESDQHHQDLLARAILSIVREHPDFNGTEIYYELRNRGIKMRKDDHRPVLHDLIQQGKVIMTDGKNNAKHYRAAVIKDQ
jgi:hypothetical protein